MKTYSKEVYIFEFNEIEDKVFNQILRKILVNELETDAQDLLEEIKDCVDSILHP